MKCAPYECIDSFGFSPKVALLLPAPRANFMLPRFRIVSNATGRFRRGILTPYLSLVIDQFIRLGFGKRRTGNFSRRIQNQVDGFFGGFENRGG